MRARRELVPLTQQQQYLLQVGVEIPRKFRIVRAKENEASDPIPLFTRLGREGQVENVYLAACGCRFTIVNGSPKVFFDCRRPRECEFVNH